MLPRYSLIGIAFSLAVILLDFYLLKKRKLQGRSFILWLAIGFAVGLFSAVPVLYSFLTVFFGTEALISAVTATAFLFLLLMVLYLHSRVSELQNLLMKLAMEFSINKHEEEKVEPQSKRVKSEYAEKQKDENEPETSGPRRKASV